jgi:hypothetical protein
MQKVNTLSSFWDKEETPCLLSDLHPSWGLLWGFLNQLSIHGQE